MRGITSYWISAGAMLAFLSVLAGAAGAHWLEVLEDVDSKNTYETALRFQMFHSLSLIIIALILNLKSAPSRVFSYSPILILMGTIIFCGSLYIISLTSLKWFGAIAPVGAVFLMIGWLTVGLSAFIDQGRGSGAE